MGPTESEAEAWALHFGGYYESVNNEPNKTLK